MIKYTISRTSVDWLIDSIWISFQLHWSCSYVSDCVIILRLLTCWQQRSADWKQLLIRYVSFGSVYEQGRQTRLVDLQPAMLILTHGSVSVTWSFNSALKCRFSLGVRTLTLKKKKCSPRFCIKGQERRGITLHIRWKKNKDEPKCVYQVKTSLQCKRKCKITM